MGILSDIGSADGALTKAVGTISDLQSAIQSRRINEETFERNKILGEQQRRENDLKLKELEVQDAFLNSPLPVDSISDRNPDAIIKTPKGNEIKMPNLIDEQISYLQQVFPDKFEDKGGRRVIKTVRDAQNMLTLVSKMDEEGIKHQKNMTILKLNKITDNLQTVQQQISDYRTKNPNASAEQFTVNEAGIKTPNPNFDPKFATLKSQENSLESGWQNIVQVQTVLDGKANELLKSKSAFGTVNPSDFTPESLSAYQQTGDYKSLVPIKKDEKIPITSDKLQGAMAELGMDITNPETYKDPANIAKASAHLRKMEAEIRSEKNEELNKFQKSIIAHQLRGELHSNPYYKDFTDVDNKFKVMKTAFEKAGTNPKSFVAIDQALITLYNKMTDPSSVVRESEYARTPENMSILNRIKGKIDPATGKWFAGGAGLTTEERQALVDMGQEFYNQYLQGYNQIVDDFSQTAEMSGIPKELIGVPYRKKGTTGTNPKIDILRNKYGY